MLKRIFWMLALALLAAGGVQAGGVNMNEGMWEITTTTEMPGMPFQMPPMTVTQCITHQDLVPQNQQPDSQCTMTNNQISGNTVIWSVVCKGEGGTTRGDGKITYHGDGFEGTMNMAMEQGMQMTNHMKGRRVGACK